VAGLDPQRQQLVESALSAAVNQGDADLLFRPETLQAAVGLAGQTQRRRFGRVRLECETTGLLLRLHLLRAAARPEPTSVDLVAAVAVGALLAGPAPNLIPVQVRAAAQELAEQLGPQLRLIRPAELTLATVLAVQKRWSLAELVVGAVRFAAADPRDPAGVAVRRLLLAARKLAPAERPDLGS
jgi:hypothetical protein